MVAEPWGAWHRPGRRDPISALAFCETMIDIFERAPEHERDALWRRCLDQYLAKRTELREQFGVKEPVAPAKQLDLLGV